MIEVILVVALFLATAMAGWWAITAREVYLNRLYGDRSRRWLIDRAFEILKDDGANTTAKATVTAWLAYVYDPVMLAQHSTPSKSTATRWDDISSLFGKDADIVREGFEHLAVLGMLENRRLGYAIRTIVGDGHPREAISIGRRPSRMESRRAPAKQPENDTRRIDETFVAIMNAPTAIETRRSLREHALEVA